MVDVSNPDALRTALIDLNNRLQAQQSQMTQLQTENTALQARLAQNTPVQVGTPQRSLVDTRVIGKPDQFNGESQKFPDWSFKLRAYMGAVDPRY